MASLGPFNRVVKLAARAFYDNLSLKGDTQPKSFRGDNRGMAVVVLDALTRREWVQEEHLAKDLKLHSKQLRRILRFFEEEKLIMREHRKESPKGKAHNTATPAASDGQPVTKEGEEKSKMHTYSYCCLDYAQDELDSRDTIQHYICHSCHKRYSAFDALQLVSYTDEYFHCETCNGELVAERDKLVSGKMGAVNDNARKYTIHELKDMQQRMDEQLKPLVAQLERVKKLPAPDFGSLRSWERAKSAANSSLRTPDSQFDRDFGGEGTAEDGKNHTDSKVKPMPPWMMSKGNNNSITERQRGEISGHIEREEEDAKRRMHSQSERHVGEKYKREDQDEGIEWEEDQAAGNSAKTYKMADLSAEAQDSGDDEDGIEWEEG
ncbi:hypothetical protein EJB05_21817 [Eragrostis curvula]|uniref:HTH TFE/IIEalpha-type domain-containing protein n=1 Tax=Eragrostis curvula TaxID=38414 RepID=A0A5J9V473_9POAL|nr:hypothetical protein EJB05_21817 [Eragrostis curvula]